MYLVWPSELDRSVILVISIILAEEQNGIENALLPEVYYCMSPDMNRFMSSSIRLLFDPNDPYCGNDGNKAPYQSSRRSRFGIGLPSKEINWRALSTCVYPDGTESLGMSLTSGGKADLGG